jgi:hypothetical protein
VDAGEDPLDPEHPPSDVRLPDEPDDPALREALRALLGPADDLRSVAAERVDRRLRGSSLVGTLSDMSSVGWETLRHLLTNPPPDADREDDCEVQMSERDP